MGSFIEINDTLRISKTQGFPENLDINKHLNIPYKLKDFRNKIFQFKGKQKIRIYKIPPVRNFLVEDLDGKWIYWGLCHIIEVHHDYIGQITSGRYKIIYINTPQEVKKAHELIDRNPKTSYF